jgi:hypothetical protein
MATATETIAGIAGRMLLVAAAARAAGAQTFIDATGSAGIGPYSMADGMGGGASAADYDGDGDVDVFVPNGSGVADQLYRNEGDGTFTEIAAQVCLASTASSRAALWLDHDGDGDLDLLVAGDCWHSIEDCAGGTSLRLYRHDDDGCFVDVTVAAGLHGQWFIPDLTHAGGLAAGDLDGNGFLDVVIGGWEGELRVFMNGGEGSFTDATAAAGFARPIAHFWQPLIADFDGDRWMDLFVAVDFGPNLLFHNQHDATFAEVGAAAGVGHVMNDMGVAAGDVDGDGDVDLYVTNIFGVDGGAPEHNLLYRNDGASGAPAFTDVAQAAGVDDGAWGWGTTFLDADRDGHLDIAATNGWTYPPWSTDTSRLFRSLGGDPVSFEDVSDEVGFDDPFYGSALLSLDYDRDGDLDLLQTCADAGAMRLLANQSAPTDGRHWLAVRPRMAGPNTHAIGAVVRVLAGGAMMTRVITAGTSFLGQEPAESFFGLGASTVAGAVSVEWPGGGTRTLANVAGDRVVTVWSDESPADVDGDGAIGFGDLLLLLGEWGPCPPAPAPCGADVDGDGARGFGDLIVILAEWAS